MNIRVKYDSSDFSLNIKETAEICFKCGVCCVVKGHSCHAQYDDQFNPKYTFVYDCLGTDEPSNNPNIWLCVSCHKCEEICPYDVSPVKFIEAIKAQSFERGNIHPVLFGELDQITSTGYAFPLTRASERRRQKLGLGPLGDLAANDVKNISERTGLSIKLKNIKEGVD